MRFVIEMSDRERDALRKAGENIKGSLKKVKDSFQIRIVSSKRPQKEKKKKTRRKKRK